jgi:hypothetical protein
MHDSPQNILLPRLKSAMIKIKREDQNLISPIQMTESINGVIISPIQ